MKNCMPVHGMNAPALARAQNTRLRYALSARPQRRTGRRQLDLIPERTISWRASVLCKSGPPGTLVQARPDKPPEFSWAIKFVIVGAPRTGSTLLVKTLNNLDGVCCHGELLGPENVRGYEDGFDLVKASKSEREARSQRLLLERNSDPIGFIDRTLTSRRYGHRIQGTLQRIAQSPLARGHRVSCNPLPTSGSFTSRGQILSGVIFPSRSCWRAGPITREPGAKARYRWQCRSISTPSCADSAQIAAQEQANSARCCRSRRCWISPTKSSPPIRRQR